MKGQILTFTEGFRLLLRIFFNITFLIMKNWISISLLWITPVLWDWGLTWVAPFIVVFLDSMDWILSYMDKFPLSVGGGGSDAGPSRRPVLDLNRTPQPELDLNQPPAPEPAPEQQPGLSRAAFKEELRKTVKRIRVFQGHLNYWERLLEISLQKERESEDRKSVV